MTPRQARRMLGSRSTRRKGTKLHTQTLHKVKGPQRASMRVARPAPRVRVRELVRAHD